MRPALQIAVIERTQRMMLLSDDHDEHTCRHDVCDNSSQPFTTRKCLPEARWPEKNNSTFLLCFIINNVAIQAKCSTFSNQYINKVIGVGSQVILWKVGIMNQSTQ
jgi:hypothetical protein